MHTEIARERGLETILRDPLVRLAMLSDGVSDGELRSVLRRVQLAVLRRARAGLNAGGCGFGAREAGKRSGHDDGD